VRLLVVADDDLGTEGPAGLGAKALQRADLALAQQGLGLGSFKGAAGGRLAKAEAARRCAVLAGAGIAAVVFLDHAGAVRAGRLQRGVVAGDGVAVVFPGFCHHALGHRRDVGHEGRAAELALFHLRELELPLAGQVGAAQFLDLQPAQQQHELKGFGRGDDLAAFAQHVLFRQQSFDDGRARGGRAQALCLHGLAQFVVVELLAGALHRAQQRGFGVAGRRLGLEAPGVGLQGEHPFAGLHRHQVLALVALLAALHLVGRFLAVDGQPAGLDQHLAFGLEAVHGCGPPVRRYAHRADARGHGVFRVREENRDEAAHHQVVQPLLGVVEAAGRLQRGDDGKVIADLAAVEDAPGHAHIAVVQRRERVRRQVAHGAAGEHLESLARHRQIVFGQRARIGARIGQGLVALVQALRQRQCGLGREAELAVGLALQTGQVKQRRRGLRARLALFADAGRLVAHGLGNRLGLGDRPQALGPGLGIIAFLPLGVEPFAGVWAGCGAKQGVHFPVVAADELADFFLALDHQRQRGRLHPAHGGQEETAIARVERRHRAGAVDAHQPVGLGAAARRAGQALHLLLGAQRGKAVANRLRRHRLQPQALDRLAQGLVAAGVLLDQAKNQLPLAARVAGVDQRAHVPAPGLLDHCIEAALGLVHGLEVKVRRNHRQVRKTPLAALDLKLLGRLNFHQVADSAGDDIALVLEVVLMLVELARHGGQCAHDVLRHRRLFCNYQGLGHVGGSLASRTVRPGTARALLQFGSSRIRARMRASPS